MTCDTGCYVPKQVKKFSFRFGQVLLSQPQIKEIDGLDETIFPNVARMRNLTYCSPVFCDVSTTIYTVNKETGEETQDAPPSTDRVFIGKV